MESQRWIMHLDMDAFFASIEELDNPEYKGKPLIIGGGTRGVVSTASYEARKYGVRSAMAISEARRLCPKGVFVLPRMARYAEMSRMVGRVLQDFSPHVEAASIDEAYLDATGLERIFGPVNSMGMQLKAAVKEATGGLTCSVGIAPVKFLAKISSEVRKPDGLFWLKPEDTPDFLAKLEVGRIPFVGKKFVLALQSLGVKTCADVMRYPPEFWARRFGKQGMALFERSQGLDDRPIVPYTPPKSESAELTLEADTYDRDFLRTCLLRHAERVGRSLRRHGLAGRTVTLKVKYADFHQITRQMSLLERTASTETIYEAVCGLLDALDLENKVRLIGLGVSGFDEARPRQLSLMDLGQPSNMPAQVSDEIFHAENRQEIELRRKKLDNALDTLREKYGGAAVVRGKLFDGKK